MDASAKEALVQKIKDGQRVSQEWRLSWANYCDVFGERKRDPNTHDEAFLQSFLDRNAHIDLTPSPEGAPKKPRDAPPPAAPSTPEVEELVVKVKEFQKTQGGRQMWETWCINNGTKNRDPARYEAPFLQKFLFLVGLYDPFESKDKKAESPVKGAKAPAMMMGAMGGMMGGMSGMGGMSSMGMASPVAAGSGPVRARLVDQIKEQQRSNPTYRQEWTDYCNKYGRNQLDPNRHDVAFLHQWAEMQQPDAKPHKVIRASRRPDTLPAMPALAMEQDRMVQQIKDGQRNSLDFKQAWGDWCTLYGGRQRDPAKQPPLFLAEFLATRNMRGVVLVNLDDPERSDLVAKVKEGQKRSVKWKDAWVKHCEKGDRDPNLHSGESLRAFLADVEGLLPSPPAAEE